MADDSQRKRNAIWSIGMYSGPSPLDLRPAAGCENPVLTAENVSDVPACFVADPFMLKAGEEWHMFFEVMNARTGRGEIGWATSSDGFKWKYRQIVLREAFHLSYPHVFAADGEYYMVPESHKAGGIRLYRALDFPKGWTFAGELLEGTFADTSLFHHDRRWWLFTFESLSANDPGRLRLFTALELTGPWTEHPRSPVVDGNGHIARPAGRVVTSGGRLIRFAQDCEPVYGREVRAFEITLLTTRDYSERECTTGPLLTAAGSGWNESGMHHVDPHNTGNDFWLACADGFVWEESTAGNAVQAQTAGPLQAIKQRFRDYRAYNVASDVKAAVKRHYGQSRSQEPIRLTPAGKSHGRILFSYFTHAFTGQPLPYTHTAFWESRRMAEVLAELGYTVDVISAADAHDFQPDQDYGFFFGHRQNFDRIARLLPSDCVKVLHCDVAHWMFHNAAGYGRALALQQRRGVTLPVLRLQEPNFAIEHADCATILGNEFTISTYRHANKPMHRVHISAPAVYPWPSDKDFDNCRKHFLWFNSNGFVHKGLDLVLEAFAAMPEYRLTICGPMNDSVEKPFERVYFDELYRTPNIHVAGWVEDGSPQFVDVAGGCVAVISPSCSEGGGGSVISCMHAGLIPIVSYETSVDTDPFGFVLRDCSIESIMEAVRTVAGLPERELRNRARAAWEYAQANHTRERFTEEYRKTARTILSAYGRRTAWQEVPERQESRQAVGSIEPLRG